MTDAITLTIPPQPDYRGVAHLVVGGLALRLDVTYDVLEDIQIALDELLARAGGADDVTVSVEIHPDALHTSVGPLGGDALRRELEHEATGMGLRRLLETLADEVALDGDYVRLTKSVQTRSEVA